MFSIPPQVSMWLNVLMAGLGGVVAMTPVAGSGPVAQGAGLAMAVLGVINTFLHASSAPVPGPLAK